MTDEALEVRGNEALEIHAGRVIPERVIVAAPDMYGALGSVHETLSCVIAQVGPRSSLGVIASEAQRIIREARAKAEG